MYASLCVVCRSNGALNNYLVNWWENNLNTWFWGVSIQKYNVWIVTSSFVDGEPGWGVAKTVESNVLNARINLFSNMFIFLSRFVMYNGIGNNVYFQFIILCMCVCIYIYWGLVKMNFRGLCVYTI